MEKCLRLTVSNEAPTWESDEAALLGIKEGSVWTTAALVLLTLAMSIRKPQPEALGLSQSQASSRVLSILPMIAFPLTVLIGILTAPGPILWMIDVFARGGNGAHLEEGLPRVAQLTDVRGVGHFERLSSSKWASLSHIIPGRYFDLRK